jgi:hypothetical protein
MRRTSSVRSAPGVKPFMRGGVLLLLRLALEE